MAGITAFGPSFTIGTTVQLGSMSSTTVYASKWIGGIWLPLNSEGAGCSSCTLRGSIGYNYDTHGHVLTRTDEAGKVTSYNCDSNGNVDARPLDKESAWRRTLRPIRGRNHLLEKFGSRFAIRAAKFGPEADFVSRAVGEKSTAKESQSQRRNEGPLRGQ